jgi:hypothetical protein
MVVKTRFRVIGNQDAARVSLVNKFGQDEHERENEGKKRESGNLERLKLNGGNRRPEARRRGFATR